MYFDIIFVLQNAPKVNAYYFKSHPNSIRPKAPSDEGAGKNLRFLTEGEIQRQHFLSPSLLLRKIQPPRHTRPQAGVQSATGRSPALSAAERGPFCALPQRGQTFPQLPQQAPQKSRIIPGVPPSGFLLKILFSFLFLFFVGSTFLFIYGIKNMHVHQSLPVCLFSRIKNRGIFLRPPGVYFSLFFYPFTGA